jgi:hypothetical protein
MCSFLGAEGAEAEQRTTNPKSRKKRMLLIGVGFVYFTVRELALSNGQKKQGTLSSTQAVNSQDDKPDPTKQHQSTKGQAAR